MDHVAVGIFIEKHCEAPIFGWILPSVTESLHFLSLSSPPSLLDLKQFKVLENEEGRRTELAEVNKLLRQDLRNNSAWNHRWFVLHSALGSKTLSDEARAAAET